MKLEKLQRKAKEAAAGAEAAKAEFSAASKALAGSRDRLRKARLDHKQAKKVSKHARRAARRAKRRAKATAAALAKAEEKGQRKEKE